MASKIELIDITCESCRKEYNKRGKAIKAKYKSRIVHFKKPLVCDLFIDGRLFKIINNGLEIRVSGSTIEKAKANFAEELFFLIDEYLHEKDENLTAGAQDLKRKLEAIIDVEPRKKE